MFEKARALIIAVNAYKDPNIEDLSFAFNDAKKLRCQLLENGFIEKNVNLIADGATRTQIYAAMCQLAKDLRALPEKLSALTLIFFSGHSWYEQDLFDLSLFEETLPGQEAPSSEPVRYLLPYDAKLDNLSGTAIPLEDFKRMVNNLRASQVALLLDACYSGIKGHKGIKGELVDSNENYLSRGLGIGRVVIASSKGSQPSYEYDDLGNGVFTHYLLEALKGNASFDERGLINHEAVGQYVMDKVVNFSVKNGRKQEPTYESIMENLPGVVLAVNPEAYFLNHIDYSEKNSYLGERVKLALRHNAVDGRTDLDEIKKLASEFIRNPIDLELLVLKIQKYDRDYLVKLREGDDIGEFQFERIVSSQDDPNATTANGQINLLTQKFLCKKVTLQDFVSQIDEIDIAHIKNEISVPFSPGICNRFCDGMSGQKDKSSIRYEVQQILRQICAGKIESDEGKRKIVDIAREGIVKLYSAGGKNYEAFDAVLGWGQADSNPIVSNLIGWIWQILLGEIDPKGGPKKRLINNAINEFENLSGELMSKFDAANQSIDNKVYEAAANLFLDLAQKGCPPPRSLFGDEWENRKESLSLKADLKELALQGNYSKIAQALGKIEPVFRFSKKLQDTAKKGYLSDPMLPFLESQDPYTILARYNIDFHTSQKTIRDLMVPEQQAYDTLRKVESRLFIDWQFYSVSDVKFLEKVVKDTEEQLSVPRYEQLLKLANAENLIDIFIISVVAEAREQAHLFLEEQLLARPIPAPRGSLCHFVGLSYFASAIESESIQDKNTLKQYHQAIAYLTINLIDDGFWEEFKRRRQEVYGSDIEKARVENVRNQLTAAISEWFVQRTADRRATDREHDAEIYNELRLKFRAEIAGAELLKKVGGLALEGDSEQNFVGGALGIDIIKGQTKLEEAISKGDISKLSREEQKLFPCLFSEYNTTVILRDENPVEALRQMNLVLESADHPRYIYFVQLAVDTEIQIANDYIGTANLTRKEITEAIEHWKRAYVLSSQIEKQQNVTRILIINQVVGRGKYFAEQSQKVSASGRHRDAIVIDQIAISLIEAVLKQLFEVPEDIEYARKQLITPLASFYADMGIEICNHLDDYQQGARSLRRAVELNPIISKTRIDFLKALLNAADLLFMKGRRAESRIFYEEAKNVAEIGEQQGNNASFTNFKERAVRGIKGEIDFF